MAMQSLTRPSNLHSIQLRPRVPDSLSRVVNPTFTVERRNNASDVPLSPLYNAMHGTFPTITIAPREPRAGLITDVLAHLPAEPSVATIQAVLSEQCQRLFGLTIDFTHQANGTVVDKAGIDTLMGFSPTNVATSKDYIEALLGMCASDIRESIPTPPFYSIPEATLDDEGTERLSILTQFFLAHVNVYCKARGISTRNFGADLDASPDLSKELVDIVATTLEIGSDIERNVVAFINEHQTTFGLSRPLTSIDNEAIRQIFERTYRTVTATKENPHMDDFMLLDKEATGETAKFVTHQGSLCVDFAEIIDPTAASANPDYFESIRADFVTHPAEIPHRNESVAGSIDIDIETLMTRLNHEQFERLPQAAKDACRAHPSFQARHFLSSVAKATPDKTDPTYVKTEAEALLTATPDHTQTLLRTPGIFTDYSGRTFNCTAYEYAYWAKDTHMCRMLESHMDIDTKAIVLERIDAIEATGLSFQQNGEAHQSPHFDLTPLKTALQDYVNGFDAWNATSNWAAMEAAWMVLGKAQRDVPTHIAEEYCRPDRSFFPVPSFNVDKEDIPKETLPRVLRCYNHNTRAYDSWFPLRASHSGPGFDFALIRALAPRRPLAHARWAPTWGGLAAIDLAAITRLDEVRAVDLTHSREHLSPPASTPGMSM